MYRRITTVLLASVLALGCAVPALADDAENQQETQIGAQVAQQLRGEIIPNSPYYNILNPIAQRIKSVADKQYYTPFHFILVHEAQPNAFAVPGGNVYVTDSMMSFVKNKEELAGVLCHETSHDIHHDVMNNMRKDQNLQIGATVLSLLLGGGRNPIISQGIGFAANLQSMTFSREVEHNADHKGAYTCAQAGINPWGMVWLFNQFEANPTPTPPEALSDHPRDDHRISDLEDEFKADPATFGKFNPDISSATPLNASGFRTTASSQAQHRRQTPASSSTWKFSPRRCCEP